MPILDMIVILKSAGHWEYAACIGESDHQPFLITRRPRIEPDAPRLIMSLVETKTTNPHTMNEIEQIKNALETIMNSQ